MVRLDDERALVQTVDFFTPVVDDPYTYGAIAAANALSDVYAMGGTPLSALNVLCFPNKVLGVDVLRAILEGGRDKVLEAGAVLAGGHSVRDDELKFGMSVTGLVHPDRVWSNAGAQPGDALVLTKPLGTGILTTALKRDAITAARLEPAVAAMAALNKAPMLAAAQGTVHACTDITGNGLAGHAYEMATGSGVTLRMSYASLPLHAGVTQLAEAGHVPGGHRSNLSYVGDALVVDELTEAQVKVVVDPQTSGGLLFAVPADQVSDLLQRLIDHGVEGHAIGVVEAGPARLIVGR